MRHRRLSRGGRHILHVRLRSHYHRRPRLVMLLRLLRGHILLLGLVWRLPPLWRICMLCRVGIERLMMVVRIRMDR